MNGKINTKNAAETKQFAHELAKQLKGGEILCLYGNLGSGKTTFVQGLAEGLGIKHRIISPTFIIVRSYKLNKLNFFHIDLYRVDSASKMIGLGIDEIFNNKKNIIAVEWAEKLGKTLPKRRIDIKFTYLNKDQRNIDIKSYE